jgi:processive 1,2-diacylglycerol beta-glucosyltransferase
MVAPLIAPPILTTTASGPGVLVISGSVGAGHDGAARELAERLIRAGAVGHVPAAFEFLFQRLERRGLLWRIEQRVCATAEAAVTRWVFGVRPDVVVSTYPLTSQTLGAMRADGRLSTPVITFLTDQAVHTSWLHPAVDAHLTVTAATADQGSADYGMSFTVAGPLVPVRFPGASSLEELVDLRRDLGLPGGRPCTASIATPPAGMPSPAQPSPTSSTPP